MAYELHPHEKIILAAIARLGIASPELIAADTGLPVDSVHKAMLWASTKGLLHIEETIEERYELTKDGEETATNGLPEKNLLRRAMDVNLISKLKTTMKVKDFGIAIMWARKKGWVELAGDRVKLTAAGEAALKKAQPEESIISGIKAGRQPGDAATAAELVRRKLLKVVKRTKRNVRLTAEGKGAASVLKGAKTANEIGQLTADMIKSGSWRGSKFRRYDVALPAAPLLTGKRHIITQYVQKIRRVFFDMGFAESAGPFVESAFWCFDALYQPQDHPAREMADTFFMKSPKQCKLPDKRIVDEVRKAHEDGGATGSTGWRYKWSPDIAANAVLRTHTTAVSARNLLGVEPPAKIFCIGRVFRNETVDYKHLPEFTQIEGIVADENVTFRDLLGYLKEFYFRLGFKKIRFRPAYFPYTEMSVEPEVYFEERGEWIELGGAGIFRPEVTAPLGVDCPVLAWGLGLERPIMLALGLNDIRNFYYRNDLKLLRESTILR